MKTYQLYFDRDNELSCVTCGPMAISIAPTNTDYQNFKAEILADEAQLADAEGNVMSPEAAKAYVATLP
jgi:hypothetical protein